MLFFISCYLLVLNERPTIQILIQFQVFIIIVFKSCPGQIDTLDCHTKFNGKSSLSKFANASCLVISICCRVKKSHMYVFLIIDRWIISCHSKDISHVFISMLSHIEKTAINHCNVCCYFIASLRSPSMKPRKVCNVAKKKKERFN